MKNVIECGMGWKTLYEPVIHKVLDFDKEKDDVTKKIGLDSITSESGLLKIKVVHPSNLTEEIKTLINSAYVKSKRVCEFCGTSKNVGTTCNGEYQTCCKSCWVKYILPNKDMSYWKSYENGKTYKKKK